MADQNKKPARNASHGDTGGEELKAPEKRIPASEQAVHFGQVEKKIEKKEISPEDKLVSDELNRQIEMLESDPSTKKEAEVEREKIEYLGEKDKIEHLLEMARTRGVVFAIQVARKMNEPFLLDTLHDILEENGYFQNFIKK